MTTLWCSFLPLERLGGSGPSPYGFLTVFVAVVEAIKLEFYMNLTGVELAHVCVGRARNVTQIVNRFLIPGLWM